MRKTHVLAVIACILGIVLLAFAAFYIPEKLGSKDTQRDSELFTGFNLSSESSDSADASSGTSTGASADTSAEDSSSIHSETSIHNAKQEASSEAEAGGTLPESSTEKESVSGHPSDSALQTERSSGHNEAGKDTRDQTEDQGEDQTESEVSYKPSGSGKDSNSGSGSDSGSDSGSLSGTATVRKHQIIWVGDSRTLGLRDALHLKERVDNDIFVGRVGEGIHWFQEEGMAEMSDAIEANPDLPVVINFGVNDPQLVDTYIETYHDMIDAYPDTAFYFLSVNPLDEEFLIEDGLVDEAVFEDINSLNVAKMNVKLKEKFPDRYIDSASYLKSDGFDTVDGLHFSVDTYLKIHDFVVEELFG